MQKRLSGLRSTRQCTSSNEPRLELKEQTRTSRRSLVNSAWTDVIPCALAYLTFAREGGAGPRDDLDRDRDAGRNGKYS